MPKFQCTYAYNIPFYLDFVVEAETEDEAQAKCEAALVSSQFDTVSAEAQPCYHNQDDDRVFTSGLAAEQGEGQRTLEDIIAKSKTDL